MTKGVLYGMGNPLLDMTAVVDEAYLKKYDLLPNNAILAEDKHRPIYDELLNENYKVSYSPGGATQNTIRVAQWYLQEPESTSFVGCIGQDTFGDKLKACMKKEDIRTNYLVDPAMPTGVCAVLITGGNRSLVTRLDAANNYKHSHLTSSGTWSLVEDASFYYIAGYFLTVSPDSMVAIGEHAVASNKCFSMNLSAPFLSQFFKEPMKQVLPYCDIVFGNEDEARAFAKDFELNTDDLAEIAKKVAAMPKKNLKRNRIVIFTQGADPAVVYMDGDVKKYPVLPILPEDIVDTNGAGDAFVGGFLAEYVKNSDIKTCVMNGMHAAHMIIQVSGCSLPERQ